MSPHLPFPVLVVAVAALAAAVTDLWKLKVHNVLTLPLLVTGLFYHGIESGVPGLWNSTLGILLGFSLFFLLYMQGGIGAGDVKLVAGLGAWLGFWLTVFVCLFAALAGGIYAAAVILWRGKHRETWLNFLVIWHRVAAASRHFGTEDGIEGEVTRPDRHRRVIPYALMIALGVLTLLVVAWRDRANNLLVPSAW